MERMYSNAKTHGHLGRTSNDCRLLQHLTFRPPLQHTATDHGKRNVRAMIGIKPFAGLTDTLVLLNSFNSTYYGKDYRAGAALLRARRPYLVKNAVTGFGLFAFAIAVYSYTIRAVGQEDFSDVKVPDTPVKKLPEQK
ncbi:hypothetical protein N7539_003066 [Penicillium diatomitis]|uniref:Cytochrome c oxidase assembly factor 3 n=1 Tax=Penicillium diatomitis TaxID=2819901 RepID=A0A9W9XFX6_9EURO|nr:uncharacterized protein N7539_003066 [Penicillium diatomitis]KAJ5491499.1 hypothetical protein N7539_003066 [Penicillium diatomitis]